jgi:glycine dehydrogenase subunit 1
MLGAGGLAELGVANLTRITALRKRVEGIAGVTLPFGGPVFNETVLRLAKPAAGFRAFARRNGVLAGILLDGVANCGPHDLLVSVTEKRTAAEIENFGRLLEMYLSDENPDGEVTA